MAEPIRSSASLWRKRIPLPEARKLDTSISAGSLTFPFPKGSRCAPGRGSCRGAPLGSQLGLGRTFHVRSEEDFKQAVWLLRLSYLRYAMKTAAAPRELFDRQSEELHLSPQFRSLLEPSCL